MRPSPPRLFVDMLTALLLLALGLLVTPASVTAQAETIARVGILSASLPRSAVFYRALEERLLNRKTAAALGVALPQALLLRADRVLE